ncbi:GrpB family protein [Tropicimonas marinistellae]|uniref:GrpB family protein n=1 Tax=Tropicimonas marinistellae TaxID=1739787 RepID=UPI00082BD0CE|nr:GrpB family protein [Tropicimonas marinistellae]
MTIELAPYSLDWAWQADQEADRWSAALGDALVTVHHIGSTAVPNLAAKPIIDLLPEIAVGIDPDRLRGAVEGMGYEWLGEYGLPRRRYCRRDDPATGRRVIQAHCWVSGDPEILRHLAFRDALRADPLLISGYESRKRHCASLHPNDTEAYCRCKSTWIDTVEAKALETKA